MNTAIQMIQNQYTVYPEKNNVNHLVPSLLYYDHHKPCEKWPERLGWCYGESGVLRALYLTAVWEENEKLTNMIKCRAADICRRPIEDYNLTCPTFCHGFSGLYHILNLFYDDFPSDVFPKKINELEKQIWDMGNDANLLYFRMEGIRYADGTHDLVPDNTGVINGAVSVIIPYLLKNSECMDDYFSKSLFLK